MKTIISKKLQKNTPKTAFFSNIEKDTLENTNYRKVLFTTKNSQLVLMSLKPGEEIGTETHDLDQFFRFEAGQGEVIIEGTPHKVTDGDSATISSGTKHNIINISETEDLKLYSIYSPPNHKQGTIHKTKADDKEEHFDNKTDVS